MFWNHHWFNLSIVLIILSQINSSECHRRQFELGPDIPAHMPSPPKAEAPSPPASNTNSATGTAQAQAGSGTGSGVNLNFGPTGPLGFTPGSVIPPQNAPVGPLGLAGLGIPPEDLVPFGLNHIILIIVPQFKTKFRKLPGWLESSVKVAMPITVFFDKLELGPNFPPGLLPPSAQLALAAQAGAAAAAPPGSPQAIQQAALAGQYPYAWPYGDMDEDEDSEDDEEPDTEDDDPYESYYADDRRNSGRRRKRSTTSTSNTNTLSEMDHTLRKIRNKRSVPFNKTVHSAERAALLPKLENLLDSQGLGGKSCLLRAVCEVHEGSLHHYGLLGELFTLFFSVSRSAYAESHLPEYLRAEKIGRTGDCSEYHKDCEKTMFSWVEPQPFSDFDNILYQEEEVD